MPGLCQSRELTPHLGEGWMLRRCNTEPTLDSFSGEETETHCSPFQKVSKPGLAWAGSLVQPKPGRLFGRPVYAYKGRKWRRREVSVQREYRGDPTEQQGRVLPGEEGGPPQGRQQLKARLHGVQSVGERRCSPCGLGPSQNTSTLPTESPQRTPFSSVFTLTLGWDLPHQWPGWKKGQEEKGLPKPKESALVGEEPELRETATPASSLGQFLPVDMTSSDTQLFPTIMQG